MYLDFYNLKENPFNVTADPEFYFPSARHEEAFSHLIYGIQQRKGITVISGEIGTGKTTLCRTLLNNLDTNVKTAFILNPVFSEVQLLQIILNDFGIIPKTKNKLGLITALNQFLLDESSKGNNLSLIIDEAQNLKVKQLEHIRLLSNLETEKEKLLQIILVGQPELIHKLNLPSLRQLNQRVAVRYHVLPLAQGEVKEYVNHRLSVARNSFRRNCAPRFKDSAINALYAHSKGTPRLINILCDRALLAGFTKSTHSIDDQIIYHCSREVGPK